jgi:hypothetical protein
MNCCISLENTVSTRKTSYPFRFKELKGCEARPALVIFDHENIPESLSAAPRISAVRERGHSLFTELYLGLLPQPRLSGM